MKKFFTLIIISLCFLFHNCQKVEKETEAIIKPTPTLEIEYAGMLNGLKQKILLDTINKTASFLVETNQEDWQFQAEINDKLPKDKKWLTLKKSGNTLTIEAKDNYTDVDRKENITISVANKTLYQTETIIQYSYNPPLESFIPDIFFRNKVRNSGSFSTIESRREARQFVNQLYIGSSGEDSYIRSLVGIEVLLNLQKFECNSSQLKTIKLPNLKNVQVHLQSNSSLEHIDLTALDSLSNLFISNSILLNSLDLKDLSSLKSLNVYRTSINNLDFKNATSLEN